METQKTSISQNSPGKNNNNNNNNNGAGQIRLFDSDYTNYKATAIKTVW